MEKKVYLATIMGLMLFSGVALAAESDFPEAGITPDSPVYFLDIWGERISLFVTLNKDKKTDKLVKIAEERLAEAEEMANEGDTEAVEVAEEKYAKSIEDATEVAKLTGNENALQRIETATLRHQERMQEVYDKAPEQAKKALEKVVEKSMVGHQNAVQAITKVKQQTKSNSDNNSNGNNKKNTTTTVSTTATTLETE